MSPQPTTVPMSTPRKISIAVGLLALAGSAAVADAAKIYRWTDRNGVTHYGDNAPSGQQVDAVRAGSVREIRVQVEPSAIARLRVESEEGRYLAFADNTLAGPIEVMLSFSSTNNIVGDPPLPARATVKPRSSALVAVLSAADPGRGGDFELRMDSLPGDPNARPGDVEYVLPLRQTDFRIDQGYGGQFSHTDTQNRYAVDFAADEGTPVVAAREGVVMQVESDFDKAGLNRERYGGRANFVRILHDDGTMALYAHLRTEGVLARIGQRVRAGHTGFTTGPHLHFAVQVNRGMRLESIPFRMRGPAGPLRIASGAP